MARRYFSQRRVLVTGGAGFVGSHLIDRLIAAGDEVLCVDNLFTGAKSNIAHLHDNPRFEFMRHDICFPLFVEVDAIYNLACPASPVHYQHDPVQTTKVSVSGSINMLGLAKRLGCRILQASTSEVYGDPVEHPQTESYWGNVNPIGLRSCYDEGKRCAETLFFDYHRQHGLEIKVARIFNTYGPRMHPSDGRVVSNLMDSRPNFLGPVNIGNPVEFTIRELAELVIEMTGSRSKLVQHPLPADDPTQRRPDIALAQRELDWSPSIPLRDGLEQTIAYFRRLSN